MLSRLGRFRLIGELDPSRGVVAGLLPSAYIAINARCRQTMDNGRAQQQVVNAKPGISGVSIPKIVPEGVDALARVARPQRIGPALGERAGIGVAHLRPKQRIVQPALRLLDVQVRWHDVAVPGQYDRSAGSRSSARLIRRSNHRSLYSNLRPGAGLPFGR